MDFLLIFVTIMLIAVSFHFQTASMLRNFCLFGSVSDMYALPEYRNSFRTGLVITSFLQLSWLMVVTLKLSYPFSTAHILFLSGSLGGLILGYVSKKEGYYFHTIGGTLYFFGLALGSLVLSLQIFAYTQIILIVLSAHIVVWLISIPYFMRHKNGQFAAETLHVLLSYSWITIATIGILFLNL